MKKRNVKKAVPLLFGVTLERDIFDLMADECMPTSKIMVESFLKKINANGNKGDYENIDILFNHLC